MLLADSFRYSYSTTDLPWHFITALRREPKWFLIVTREIGIIVNNGALKWAMNSTKDTALFMVGDSVRGVGLLKLVGDQILEHKVESGPPINEIRLKPVSE